MATRRRIGVSIASTEAARRQLMQPVPCWEKVWVTPSFGSSSMKVYKWVKTEKVQVFDDEEVEPDEPLAPLPDEPEVVEGDEEEPEEAKVEATQPKDVDMDATQDDRPSEAPSPKPQQLTLTESISELDLPDNNEILEPIEPTLTLTLDTPMDDIGTGEENTLNGTEGLELDISGLGPDGLQLESAHDLSQLDVQDDLMGGPLLDQSADPFAEPTDLPE